MEKYKILLELALHRYDEVNRRNEIIDSKSKSMIAFIGVMLTIEFSAIPALINIFNKTPITNGVRILLFLGIASICCYLLSIAYFISAVNPQKKFEEAPVMDELISSGNDELDELVAKNIVSLKKCVDKNNNLIENKARKSKIGFDFLKYGVILTVILIILFILMNWRWYDEWWEKYLRKEIHRKTIYMGCGTSNPMRNKIRRVKRHWKTND